MDAQKTTRGHPDRAYGNMVRPTKRPVDSPDEILFPAGMPISHPRPQRRRSAAPSQSRNLFPLLSGRVAECIAEVAVFGCGRVSFPASASCSCPHR